MNSRDRTAGKKALAIRILLAAAVLVLFVRCSSDPGTPPTPQARESATAEGERPREGDDRWVRARRELVDSFRDEIRDPKVLEAMDAVPRHLFVPEGLRAAAYEDRSLPIAQRQTISQPFIVAAMTELLELRGGEKVLEIGTGSGYQAAVLARIAGEVYSVEILPELGERARDLLESLGYTNIRIRIGDGYNGWPEEAPFDAIIVTAAPAEVPPPLIAQLAVGGRLVIPVGERSQELLLIRRNSEDPDDITRKSVLPVRFVPMTGKAQDKVEIK
jgi:protein-L-isoaspartate(D-aspartate) O-methyltransferase